AAETVDFLIQKVRLWDGKRDPHLYTMKAELLDGDRVLDTVTTRFGVRSFSETANSSEVMNIIGDVKGKKVILLDDMVDTAGSLCGAANALVEIGGAKEVYACASHGVLSGPALQRIKDSAIKEIVFLDTIPLPEGAEECRIKQLSVAPMFAEAIERIYEEISVSTLF
ncbi:MAG: ribose-phosphate diphosphokinase, partial [Oscillospiraceae bacterium]|nr:ribose-phosphate diphosphokinase [Oscillospiraceae bacterium]